jgi:hypothetical protein
MIGSFAIGQDNDASRARRQAARPPHSLRFNDTQSVSLDGNADQCCTSEVQLCFTPNAKK